MEGQWMKMRGRPFNWRCTAAAINDHRATHSHFSSIPRSRPQVWIPDMHRIHTDMHRFCFIGVWCAAELSSVRKHEKYTKVNTNIKYKYVHNLHFKYIYIQIYAILSAWSRVELVADAWTKGAIVTSSCCMTTTTTAGSDCAPRHTSTLVHGSRTGNCLRNMCRGKIQKFDVRACSVEQSVHWETEGSAVRLFTVQQGH